MSSGAITDTGGNAFAGITSGYTVSTKPLMNFELVTSDAFKVASVTYFTGERYGSAVTVDGKNNIYVVGGHNGTVGSTAVLNDVFMLSTKREVNCAAGVQPNFECTTDGNAPTASNK